MINGQRMEPLEEVVCEVEDEFTGPVIDALSLRRGEVSQQSQPSSLHTLNQPRTSLASLQTAHMDLTTSPQ